MYQIPFEFKKFIELECDRASFIQSYLNKSGIDAPVIRMNEKNHIYVKFPLRYYNPEFRITTALKTLPAQTTIPLLFGACLNGANALLK